MIVVVFLLAKVGRVLRISIDEMWSYVEKKIAFEECHYEGLFEWRKGRLKTDMCAMLGKGYNRRFGLKIVKD